MRKRKRRRKREPETTYTIKAIPCPQCGERDIFEYTSTNGDPLPTYRVHQGKIAHVAASCYCGYWKEELQEANKEE